MKHNAHYSSLYDDNSMIEQYREMLLSSGNDGETKDTLFKHKAVSVNGGAEVCSGELTSE